MLFSMVAIGSTGDVRPYILLGRELQRRGHQTRLIAFAPFEEAARQVGMDFLPLPGSLQGCADGFHPDGQPGGGCDPVHL